MSTQENLRFQRALDIALEAMQRCQKEKNFKTCSVCEVFLECEIRKEYIKKVYESMSKGATGGFDF